MAIRHTSTPVPSSQEIRSAALYARVSTLNGQNPDMQLAELREYARRRGWTVSGEYVDLGVSGSRESRPEFNRMMAHAHARSFDAIAVWKLDRMGRSLKHLVNTLADLQAYGVAFISLRDNLDLSTPSGRLMFHVIAAMAEFERALIRERVSAGIQAARARGKRVGRRRTYVNQTGFANCEGKACLGAKSRRSSELELGRPCAPWRRSRVLPSP